MVVYPSGQKHEYEPSVFRQSPSPQIPTMVKHSLISVTNKHKYTHTAVSICQREVSHGKQLTTNGIFYGLGDPQCIHVSVLYIPLQDVPSTSSRPDGQEQL